MDRSLVTHSGLQDEGEGVKQQIKLVAQLFKVEREEMGGEEDFLTVKLLNKVNLNILL